jgi:hypothetical protein
VIGAVFVLYDRHAKDDISGIFKRQT